MDKAKINGIRLNKNLIQVTQEDVESLSCVPFYRILDAGRINLGFMTLNTIGRSFVSGTVALKHCGQMDTNNDSWKCHSGVCTLSIYPHHYRLQLLGFFLSLFARHQLPFLHMVSSNSMLTFVIEQQNCDAFIDLISGSVDLPESHVPFEQEENDEQAQFLKKKYPETRANYVEKKIKTYGISVTKDLVLGAYLFPFDSLARYGEKIQSAAEDRFYYSSALVTASFDTRLFLVTKTTPAVPDCNTFPVDVDLISFLGPHFGDRHSIAAKALHALSANDVPVFQAGCTGASISMVLPRGKGETARQALMEVFEIP